MAADTNTANVASTSSTDYWDLLKDLNADVKLDLIAKLSKSLISKKEQDTSANWTDGFAGKWQDSRTAEEITDDIRTSRIFHKREFDL